MKSVFEDSAVLHEAPEGDLVVRLKLKIEDNENKDTKSERKTASVGFINSKESFGHAKNLRPSSETKKVERLKNQINKFWSIS